MSLNIKKPEKLTDFYTKVDGKLLAQVVKKKKVKKHKWRQIIEAGFAEYLKGKK